eukprot:TRINITY_DN1528_c0_g1_i1.p1 TRINITY_DN1528_c0_g1~~TRINITY_DN1528_c0_g1_i1.p1  ORF type:complete len:112 (+),score=17.93 TRINITY_DN1528_c0_g1_i1:243-578(+)
MILSCMLSKDFWNLFSFLPLMFAPIPFIFFGTGQEASSLMTVDNTGWKAFAEFLSGFFLASAWAVIGVTYHWGKTHKSSFILGIFSNLFLALGGSIFLYFEQDDDGYSGIM